MTTRKLKGRVKRKTKQLGAKKRMKLVVKTMSATGKRKDLFGFMADKLDIVGDIESPVVPLSHWNAMKKRSS